MAMSMPRELAERLDTWYENLRQMQEMADRAARSQESAIKKVGYRMMMAGIEIALGSYDKFTQCTHKEYLEMRKVMIREAGDPIDDATGIISITKKKKVKE